MTTVPIVLLGYGAVAREFVALIAERRGDLLARHGVEPRVVAIRTASRQVRLPDGADGPGSVPAPEAWEAPGDLGAFLRTCGARVAVQAIPSGPAHVDAALEGALAAFAAGMDLVTATKTHLVSNWRELSDAAVATGSRIRISGATGAALPASDIARVSLRGFPVVSIRGSLNGTCGFILETLRDGGTLAGAIAEAQARGIAEADPTNDLSGYDNASKLVLLANLVWGRGATVADVVRESIDESTRARVAAATERGRRLIAVAAADGASGSLSVRLEEIGPDDPLIGLKGSEKGVAYDCGDLGRIMVAGGKSSPRGAAHALLKDLLGIALEPGPGGFA